MRRLFLIASIVFVGGLSLTSLWFVFKVQQLTSGFFVYEAYGPDGRTRFSRPIGVHASSQHDPFIDLTQLPRECTEMLLLSEDPRFYEHRGIEPASIWLALKTNMRSGRIVWGGSTLTQQLVKNLFLWRGKSVLRKSVETVGALVVDRMMTKNEQLAWYWNAAEFGPSLYGIAAASRHYFGKHPANLNLLECGTLVGILTNPNDFHRNVLGQRFDGRLFRKTQRLLQVYSVRNPQVNHHLTMLIGKAMT